MFNMCHKSFEANRSSSKCFSALPDVKNIGKINGLMGTHIIIKSYFSFGESTQLTLKSISEATCYFGENFFHLLEKLD